MRIINKHFLDRVKINSYQSRDINSYPFSLPIINNLSVIDFPTQVTFLIGENGSGKSTILEAIALKAGFGAEGGSKNINFQTTENTHGPQKLADALTLSWRLKPQNGYFFRAESFFNLANHIDSIAQIDARAYDSYGGKSLHYQSHGESFMSFFTHRLGSTGFYIFDEPEAALSPQRQLSLLSIMHDICKNPQSQFIIATHSPILLAYPHATIYSCDSKILERVNYKETTHYTLTKNFLNDPEFYLDQLFRDS
jgi:predicted ATPase